MYKNKKSIIMFLSITFGVTWITILVCYLCGLRYGDGYMGNIIMGLMVVPGVASLITRKVVGEDFESVRIKPRIKGHIMRYVFIYFLPAVGIITGAMLYFMVRGGLNPQETIQSLADVAGIEIAAAESSFYVDILERILIGPFAYILFTFFEVLGFFGYLLQKLVNKFGPMLGILLSSLAWGVWYIPMVLVGYSYGTTYPGYPFAGIGLMILFCLSFGSMIAYFTLKVGSVIPAALAKSSYLALSSIPVYFIASDSISSAEMLMVGPVSSGILSMAVFILIGLMYLLKARRIEWDPKKEMEIVSAAEAGRPTLFSGLKKKNKKAE